MGRKQNAVGRRVAMCVSGLDHIRRVAVDDAEIDRCRRCPLPIPERRWFRPRRLAERFGDRWHNARSATAFPTVAAAGRAEMNVAGKHDVRRAQPRRRRDDALANARRIEC